LPADELPAKLLASGLDLAMAQHLLAAAEMYQLDRLRRICEQHLVETVDLDNAATTLALAEQNHAEVRTRVGGKGAVCMFHLIESTNIHIDHMSWHGMLFEGKTVEHGRRL
jgi:hypothetical protein